LQPVDWDHTLKNVWLPAWQAQMDEQPELLKGLVVRELGQNLVSGELDRRVKAAPGVWPSNEERRDTARGVAACGLALALSRAGWTFHTLPGEAYCEKDGRRLEPFDAVSNLAQGKMTPLQWEELCAASAIGDLKLQGGAMAAAN
jgi:hypothetical protein